MHRTEYLVDSLASASIDAPADNYVDLERMILERDVGTAIFQHPPSTITFPALKVGKEAILHFAIGVKEAAWPHIKSEVRFIISVAATTGREIVFDARLHPRRLESDRGWQRHDLDLSRFEGQSIRIILQTRVAWRRSTEYAWAGWANPRLVHDVAISAPVVRRDRHPHIFLLTADALPARYLGCYGHPRVQTPHLDRLASEGVLFEQAWSQSCLTISSYASLLSGSYQHEHGVNREWQPFLPSQPSLPEELEAHGYHTLFAPSSAEMLSRATNLGQVFTETLPSLGNPRQDGAVSTRRFIHWFENRPDRPCFSWIQFFDVHPPALPPKQFAAMYYEGDPTDRRYEHLPEQVEKIRGAESLLVLRAVMPFLERGEPVREVLDLLEDTAAVLKEQNGFRPDLAEHLINLGSKAMRGSGPAEFGQWLTEQTNEMAAGRVPPQLTKWLREVIAMLEVIEKEIISWLDHVVDLRYPISMYMGMVSYFDSQIGTLIEYLKQQDVYDQSLIIVTSPHGELLQSPTLPYQHLVLEPDTLQVPLIMKLPERNQLKTGMRIGGVFDLIDLFPTLLEIQGRQPSFKLSGVSRWENILRGDDISPHDSFADGMHGLAQSIYRPPYLLARENPSVHMKTLHSLLSGGPEVLYDTISGEAYLSDLPEVAASLRETLAGWMVQNRSR